MSTQNVTPTGKPNGVDVMAATFAQKQAEIGAIKAKATEAETLMAAENAQLRAEIEALKKSKASAGVLSVKVSEKGAVSVYGLGKFPVTLYQEQMNRLLDHADSIREFMKANASSLSVKSAK